MAGPFLGVAAQAFNAQGEAVIGELGELVITQPMPSMPVGFWGDLDGRRYADTYFDMYPGVWRHGDWVRFSAEGTAIITGRSDATLNRGESGSGPLSFTASSRTDLRSWTVLWCTWRTPAVGSVS